MNIGKTIKRLRKQKDMTQEQLAEYLNISPQAVSRWEINSTLPDITFIPMLANIFDVTTDMLLCVDIEAKEKRIELIINEAENYTLKKRYEEAEKLLRESLKEYPNSYKLMENLAKVLSINVNFYSDNWNEEKKIILQEIISLSEKIVADCTDDNLRYWSIQRLCSAYASIGETEKAASFAKKMPDTTQRKLITETLKGTKKYNHMQMQIAHSVFYDVLNSIALLMNNSYVSFDEGREIYDSDECIVLYNKIIDIINILLEKGDFGDFNLLLANTYHCLTFLYAKKNESAAAMDYFKLAAKHTVIYDSVNSMPPLSDEYTSLLFKGVKFPFNTAHFPFTMSKYLLEKSFELDSLLPVSELEEIRNELRKHTEIN